MPPHTTPAPPPARGRLGLDSACVARPPLTFFCELAGDALASLLADEAVAASLRALGASVSMAMLDRGPARASSIRRLLEGGVPVTAWVVLPREDGYFATIDNAARVAATCDALLAWLSAERLAVDRIGLDIEMDIEHMEALAEAPLSLVGPALRGSRRRRELLLAEADYAALVGSLRRRGLFVETYQLPPVVDARAARSTLMARAFGMLELGADREVLMLYSSALPRGAAWVESYAPQADAIGLGVTGGGTVVVPRMGWDDLLRDLGVALRAERPIYLFSLEGCAERGWLERLRELPWESLPAPPPSREARLLDGLRGLLRGALRLEARLPGAGRARGPSLR